jgi:hypothetical protein
MAKLTRDQWLAQSNAEKFADLAELLEGPLGDLYASRDSDVYGEEPTPEDNDKPPTSGTGVGTRKGGAKSG